MQQKKNGRDKRGNGEIKLPEQHVQARARNQGTQGSFPPAKVESNKRQCSKSLVGSSRPWPACERFPARPEGLWQ